jgi:hypothetical protein
VTMTHGNPMRAGFRAAVALYLREVEQRLADAVSNSLVLPVWTDAGFNAAECLARVNNPNADPGLRLNAGIHPALLSFATCISNTGCEDLSNQQAVSYDA